MIVVGLLLLAVGLVLIAAGVGLWLTEEENGNG